VNAARRRLVFRLLAEAATLEPRAGWPRLATLTAQLGGSYGITGDEVTDLARLRIADALQLTDTPAPAPAPVLAGSVLPAPDMDQALATGGVLCHFVVSDRVITETFRGWVEHHPGDLTPAEVVWYLGLVHDLLAPTCELPAPVDLAPDRRLRAVPDAADDPDPGRLARLIREHEEDADTDRVIAAWVRARFPVIRQALFDAEIYVREHGLDPADDRAFGPLAEEFSEMAGEGL
jgi:hypothetical protein